MSFLFDDDDDDRELFSASPGAEDPLGDDSFCCPNCGGTVSYVDETTGARCCSSCFTQSQSHQDTEFDGDEQMAMISRTRSGGIRGISLAKGGRQKRRGRKKNPRPIESFDTSQPLPSLLDCLDAFQQVLKIGCVDSFAKIVGLDSRQRQGLKDSVKQIWLIYLKRWQEAAQFFGKLYPQVRFSLRDYFVMTNYLKHRMLIFQYLSHKVAKKIKREDMLNVKPPREEAGYLSDSSEGTLEPPSKSLNQPKTILTVLELNDEKSIHAAVLRLKPSMTLAASILLAAASAPFGIAPHHVARWIANGRLPLVNAFKNTLSRKTRAKMRPIQHFFLFENATVPLTHVLEHHALTLLAATQQYHPSTLMRANREAMPSGNVGHAGHTSVEESNPESQPLSLWTQESIPLLTARVVHDLGFPESRRVIDLSLALMGLKEDTSNSSQQIWLPAPLSLFTDSVRKKEKKKRFFLSPVPNLTELLGVIVVAVKLIPGWEVWKYSRRIDDSIPWLDEELASGVFQNEHLATYLNFYEQTYGQPTPDVCDDDDSIECKANERNGNYVVKLVDSILCTDGKRQAEQKTNSSAASVYIAGFPHPHQPKTTQKQKHHSLNLRQRKRTAVWVDANGVGDYIMYQHSSDPVRRSTKHSKFDASVLDSVHPHYRLLLEHIASTTSVNPVDIHGAVCELDEEILKESQSRMDVEKTNAKVIGRRKNTKKKVKTSSGIE